MTQFKMRTNLRRCSILHKDFVARIEVHAILAETCVLWQILLCELVSREKIIGCALSDRVLSMLGYLCTCCCCSCCFRWVALPAWDRCHSSQSTAKESKQQTRDATPGWLRHTRCQYARKNVHHCELLRSRRRLNSKATSKEQHYSEAAVASFSNMRLAIWWELWKMRSLLDDADEELRQAATESVLQGTALSTPG